MKKGRKTNYFVEYTSNVFDAVELKEVSDEKEMSNSFDSNEEVVEDFRDDMSPALGNGEEKKKTEEEKGEEKKEEQRIEVSESATEGGGATLTATLATSGDSFDMEKGLVVEEKEKEKEKEIEDGEIEGKWTKNGRERVKYFVLGVYNTLKGFDATYWLVLGLMVIFTSDLYTTTAFLTKYLYPFLFFIFFLNFVIF